MLSTVEVNQDETSNNHDLLSLAATIEQPFSGQFVSFKISVYALVCIHLPAVLYKSVMQWCSCMQFNTIILHLMF